jgi:hypothetical protein
MPNGRCRMHGVPSTGPLTPEGLERSRKANWKHGAYSRERRALLAENRRRWKELLALLDGTGSLAPMVGPTSVVPRAKGQAQSSIKGCASS